MQRNEGPASYPGRPVAGLPPEVSWMPDPAAAASARSNHTLTLDPTGEQCARTAPSENPNSKFSRSVNAACF